MKDIRVEYREIGSDILLIITGGDAHIGAVSTSYSSGKFPAEVHTAAVPGHKEHLLSADFAWRASKRLNRTVTVVMGIHYDNLSSVGVDEVCRLAERELEVLLHKLTPSSNE
ncbi:hypothetical protein [Paenibacillus sp. YPG26]|uniref:prenylated flavin chaperone LpdD n=1 Tax=Paenibacillus sp. YPG26 TaxID=2878915 RepID=UPI00203AAB29|nr:hypothetical protein [Paenibacillus sp. YPG26]USB31580.1 hypothetical protein LDO05_09415 [Paenibacillus sp. YPG26]